MESFSKISEIFYNSTTCLNIPFSFKLENSHLSSLVTLFQKQNSITEISITGQALDAGKLRILYQILEMKLNLKRLILSSNKINDRESIEFLCLGIKKSQIEYLDLSNNQIGDDCVEIISDMLEHSRIIAINLDSNQISKGPLPHVLSKSDRIQFFSINSNPLSYEFVSDLLGALMLCKTIKSLHTRGICLEGPAPIKENTNGYLSKKEAIILKLAYVLRFSSVIIISIDIDSTLHVQLEELEKTLVKYNTKLTAINSEGIDWKNVRYNGPLMGIYKALKANAWLSQNTQLPKEKQTDLADDIEELVLMKMQVPRIDNCESFFSNVEGDGVAEEFKKYSKKNVSSTMLSIQSSPRSPENKNKKKTRKHCNFPLAFSAETPQFTTSVKGMTFSPEFLNYDKLHDIGEISSIDFDEKRCTPVKKQEREKHLEEMWNAIKKLEINMNQQIDVCNYKVILAEEKAGIALKQIAEVNERIDEKQTERVRYEAEDKSVWPALGRIEKFMTSTNKKHFLFEKRIETLEEELKNSKEAFQKILNLIEDQKLYIQDVLKEKATKIDIEILEKNSSKLSNKLNFINSELENFRKDISRLQHPSKHLEYLNQELARLKDMAKHSDSNKSFENFQHEISSKYNSLEAKLSEFINTSSTLNSTRARPKVNPEPNFYKFRAEPTRLEASPSVKCQVPPLDLPKAMQKSNASLEELRKKISFSTERCKTPSHPENFLPGEAESLVLSAIMDKANNSRMVESLKKQSSGRSISPMIVFKSKIKAFEAENTPSAQLQETLRQRGIPIDSKGALTERRK